MLMWRCPHCRTPQPESGRCWVCHQSSTACATCRHFRRSVAAQLGYCGLDPRRAPLAGTEIRACWETPLPGVAASAGVPDEPVVAAPERHRLRTGVRGRDFVPIAPVTPDPPAGPAEIEPPEAPPPGAMPAPLDLESRWSLWGDLEG